MSQIFRRYVEYLMPICEQELSPLRPVDCQRVLIKTRQSLWLNRRDFKHIGQRGAKSRFRTWARPIFEYERREFIRESLQRRDELRAFREQASVCLKVAPRLCKNLNASGPSLGVLLARLAKRKPQTVPVIKLWLNRKPYPEICQTHGLTTAQFRRQLGEFLELIDNELCYLNRIECRSLNNRIVFESSVASTTTKVELKQKTTSPVFQRQAQELFRKTVRIDLEFINGLMLSAAKYPADDVVFIRRCLGVILKMFEESAVDMNELARQLSFITEVAPDLLDL